jgi:hypothetical protein
MKEKFDRTVSIYTFKRTTKRIETYEKSPFNFFRIVFATYEEMFIGYE